MKLLFCRHCQDIIRLRMVLRTCDCGRVKGKYVTDRKAIYTDDQSEAVPLGLDNFLFSTVLQGKVYRIPIFVIDTERDAKARRVFERVEEL